MTETGTLGFGVTFTPHMVIANFHEGTWSRPRLVEHADLAISPAAMAMHYGQAIFEGLKAYLWDDGSVHLFRPQANARRFARSAERLAMPPISTDVFIESCEELVRKEGNWIPGGVGRSLYLRPVMFASEASLGVRPATDYLFVVIASPVDHFFATGSQAIDVWCSPDHVRAVAGGTGEAKCAGNYAGSLAAKAQAVANGCHEVLWLDARERKWIEELGAMNFVGIREYDADQQELVTPPLAGTILHGSTRSALLELARHRAIRVTERPISLAEVLSPESCFVEAFGCGTAATVVPIRSITVANSSRQIGDGEVGVLTASLRDDLLNVQHGRQKDPFGWMRQVR